MFGLSPIQLLICGVVAILLFGSRLPTVARSLGKSLSEFRRGMNDLQHEFRSAMHEADEAARAVSRSPVQGAQSRISGPASVAHDPPSTANDPPTSQEPAAAPNSQAVVQQQSPTRRDDSACDSVYDSQEVYDASEPVTEDEALAAVDRREGGGASPPSTAG
jgi:sec-independent protein translocase protein TatA